MLGHYIGNGTLYGGTSYRMQGEHYTWGCHIEKQELYRGIISGAASTILGLLYRVGREHHIGAHYIGVVSTVQGGHDHPV